MSQVSHKGHRWQFMTIRSWEFAGGCRVDRSHKWGMSCHSRSAYWLETLGSRFMRSIHLPLDVEVVIALSKLRPLHCCDLRPLSCRIINLKAVQRYQAYWTICRYTVVTLNSEKEGKTFILVIWLACCQLNVLKKVVTYFYFFIITPFHSTKKCVMQFLDIFVYVYTCILRFYAHHWQSLTVFALN